MPEATEIGAVEGTPRRRSAVVLVLLTAVSVVLTLLPAGTEAVAQSAEVVTGPVRFEALDGGVLAVTGRGRFLDTLEFRRSGAGQVLVNELPIEDYVAGVEEMPARWPLEALKAQAVAARTYAWHVMRNSDYEGYDLCATVACQVFSGADAAGGSAATSRWRRAVEATAGEVLLADGAPILARYFSTSGGRTYANEEAFPSSGPRDYLLAHDDPFDRVSPFHRWTATFTREQFDDILSRGDTLGASVPVDRVERLGAADDPGATIAVTGRNGTTVEVGARAFQRFVSDVAPQRFPEHFPGDRRDGRGSLPSTVPSSRFDVAVTDDAVILSGQGWGHGVGMGQYGARARAESGADYRAILGAYYNGLVPQSPDELPERVRVGMASQDRESVSAEGPMRIRAGDQVLEASALGTWSVRAEADSYVIEPPEGHGRSLEVSPTRSTAEPGARPGSHPGAFGDAVTVQASVNKPVLLRLEVTGSDGRIVLRRPLGSMDAGDHAAVWRFDADDGSLVAPGVYDVALVGEDATGATDATPMEVTVPDVRQATSEDDIARDGEPPGAVSLRTPALVLAIGALALAGVLVVGRSR